jgi:quercetin dioxygenase-like cupin family protein
MHLAPADLRSVRQEGLSIRFGILGPIAYALVDVPPEGSANTALERPCTRPHWGFVLAGDVTLHQAGRAIPLPVGHAFHIAPGGPEHRFEASGVAVISAFEPVELDADATEAALVAHGFEIGTGDGAGPRTVPATSGGSIEPGSIDAESHTMSNLVLTRTRMGATSGYTTEWCDLEHWGIVTAGRVTIEWERDVEILGTGDIYYCPPGPPGHRITAADPATIVDLTPLAGLESAIRVADWRRRLFEASQQPAGAGPVSVATLV